MSAPGVRDLFQNGNDPTRSIALTPVAQQQRNVATENGVVLQLKNKEDRTRSHVRLTKVNANDNGSNLPLNIKRPLKDVLERKQKLWVIVRALNVHSQHK